MGRCTGQRGRRRLGSNGFEHIPVIAVSASTSPGDESKCLAAGANAFLPKPIDSERLLQEITALLHLDWCHAPPAPSPAPPSVPAGMLFAPPGQELEVLHHFAQAGNMRAVVRQANRIADMDERYRPFAEHLRRMAEGFQSRAVLNFVERYLKTQQRTAPSAQK